MAIAQPTFSVTFGNNIKNFINKNPNNPSLWVRYNYIREDGVHGRVSLNTALSGIPGERQYNWQEAIEKLENPGPFFFKYKNMESIDFMAKASGQPSISLCCTQNLDPSKLYSHINATITYNTSTHKCEVFLKE